VPSGQVVPAVAYAEWLALGAAGVGLSFTINKYFGMSAVALWLLGVSYNVPPVRTKEWPYLDVISESANNAVRLLLGWFALLTTAFPPVSLLLSYWMLGAFFMATKRYAEYRHIANPVVAAGYRKSFRHYTEEYLLLSIVFYATASALFAGIFIVRYHLELILFVPLAAGMFTYYLRIGMRPNSPVQNPEKLYTERGFFAYMVVCFTIFVLLMFTRIPVLYNWFNVGQSQTSPLWILGKGDRPR
jgi:4-hydroxybenzoate polyprenyltransferase